MPKKTHTAPDIKAAFVELTEAALKADYTAIRRIGNKTARDLETLGDTEASTKLRSILRKKSVPLRASGYTETLPTDSKSRMPLVEELDWPETPLFLSEDNTNLFHSFINDVRNVDKLSKAGLATKPRLILSGPPGTGKTLMASHIAAQLTLPLYVVRLDSLISSFLGETAKNIRSVFEYIMNRNAVLLIDEIDAVAKMRDDRQELGELKRVVNTLIQGLDSLDEHTVIVGATNHEKLLDPAIWRRFPYKAEIPLPNEEIREMLWTYYLFNDDQDDNALLLSKISTDMSCADIMEAAYAERRRAILNSSDIDSSRITISILDYLNNQRRSFTIADTIASSDKKKATIYLSNMDITKQDISTLLGVSRQTVYKYIKEKSDA